MPLCERVTGHPPVPDNVAKARVTRCPSQFSHLGYLLLEHAVVTPDFGSSRCDTKATESGPCPGCVPA